MERMEPDAQRIQREILKFSEFVSLGEAGHTRLSFSREDLEARGYLTQLMKEAKLAVRIDSAGNILGRREGKKQGPVILTGSHLDTVRGGGRFDGVSGVVAAMEAVRRFGEKGLETVHPIEVVVFLAEEPSPFGISTIGSRAMAGKLSEETLSSLKDETGRTLEMAIRQMGGDPARLGESRRSSKDTLVCLELHIEQGPTLFSEQVSIGVVSGIVGISRGNIKVIGRNDHAGTTPMKVRKDALVAGSELVLAFEKVCTGYDGAVGTIGKVEVSPNSLNVVPGQMSLGLEARSPSEGVLTEIATTYRNEVGRISERRGVEVHFEMGISSRPVFFRPEVTQRIKRVCEHLGIPCLELPSGAGHDASHLAEVVPTGMIFVPSKDGRSHCPEEWTEFEHLRLGTEVLANTILEFDREGIHESARF